jgi:hypothetical protein
MTPSTTQALTHVHLCGACGRKIRDDWKFCAWCGEKAEWGEQAKQLTQESDGNIRP